MQSVKCGSFWNGNAIFFHNFSFPVSWYLDKNIRPNLDIKVILTKIFQYATIESGFTLILMRVIWEMMINLSGP